MPLAGPPIPRGRAALYDAVLSPKVRKALSADALYELRAHIEVVSTAGDSRRLAIVDKRAQQLAAAYKKIKVNQAEIESRLDGIDALLVRLKELMDDGTLNIGKGAYDAERALLQKRQMKMRIGSSVLRSMGAKLSGQWIDDLALGTRDAVEDWALIDAAIRTYPEVAFGKKSVKQKRAKTKEQLFRTQLIKAYKAEDEDSAMLWCPIAGKFVGTVVAAHIVNFNVGEHTARALFGDEVEEHLWNAKNGVLISKDYGKLIDSAKAVVLPDKDDPNELVFHLLSDSIGRKTDRIPWDGELQGRKLVFRSSFRPTKRYLYFKSVISVLRRRRAEVPGYLDDLDSLPDHSKTLWALPGPYLKRSILYKFSRQFGCLSAAEASHFWEADAVPVEQLDPTSDDISTTVATLATVAIHETEKEADRATDSDTDSDTNEEE